MQTTIAKTLLKLKTFQINTNQPFTWASGKKMPYYCDNRLLLSFPEARNLVLKGFMQKMAGLSAPPDAIVGVATAGIPWGVLLADRMNLPFAYVRTKQKEHGLRKMIEGNLDKGQKVIVIEDLISTGKSSLEVCSILENEGIEIIKVLSIFNYELEESKKAFEEAIIEIESLTNLNTILKIANETCLTTNL